MTLVPVVPQGLLVVQDPLVLRVSLALTETQDRQGHQDSLVPRVIQGLRDSLEIKVQLELMEPRV